MSRPSTTWRTIRSKVMKNVYFSADMLSTCRAQDPPWNLWWFLYHQPQTEATPPHSLTHLSWSDPRITMKIYNSAILKIRKSEIRKQSSSLYRFYMQANKIPPYCLSVDLHACLQLYVFQYMLYMVYLDMNLMQSSEIT